MASPWDHPRVCGEHHLLALFWASTLGSPPRMRGTQLPASLRYISHGITPAYAGNTATSLFAVHIPWDHPRVCGEHLFRCCRCLCLWGSPPRMRGTPPLRPAGGERLGIIPAYAGNTAFSALVVMMVLDHPRVCGEHLGQWIIITSSPRITSAYAGNTLFFPALHHPVRDHPRVCGEHLIW